MNSRNIIVGIYVIIFGLGTNSHAKALKVERLTCIQAIAGLELLPQVPPYLPKYASFLFSFLGRGICQYSMHGGRTGFNRV